MENTIVVNRSLNSQLFQFFIGKGATVKISEATRPLVLFLRREYLEDNTCLVGDIEKLFEMDIKY